MRIIKDDSPRFKVQGIRSLQGTGFSSEEEALKYAKIHSLMEILWHNKDRIDLTVPNPFFMIATVLVEALNKETGKKKEEKAIQKLLLK